MSTLCQQHRRRAKLQEVLLTCLESLLQQVVQKQYSRMHLLG
jgi:hypothetical protein